MPEEQPHDSNFDVIPQGSTYFFIWRVKDFALVPVPPEEYGTFFKGDSYIVICCTENRKDGHSKMESVPLKEGAGQGCVDIHFWIGSASSQDEAGVAAIKSVELDDFLGGFPIQHRETEGNESKQFLAFFRSGIRLCNGGFESGFNKVVDVLEPALFQIKGKKRPIMSELNAIGWSAMNDGDVFILIGKKHIFIWTGAKSNRMERVAAIRIANELKNELARFHLSIVILDDGKEAEQLSGDEEADFTAFLPLDGKKDGLNISSGDKLEWALSDEQYEKDERGMVKLYRCKEREDLSNQVEIGHVKDGPLQKSDLDSNDSFIVDNGAAGIWIWIGSEATKRERSSGLKYGLEIIRENGYPKDTEIHKVVEDGETVEFKSLFKNWSQVGVADRIDGGNKAEPRLFKLTQKGKFEQVIGFDQEDLEEDTVMVLDKGSKVFVWMSETAQAKVADEAKQHRLGAVYLKQMDRSGRKLGDDRIIVVKQGSEPASFTGCFPAWN